jgi:hypothetical protein
MAASHLLGTDPAVRVHPPAPARKPASEPALARPPSRLVIDSDAERLKREPGHAGGRQPNHLDDFAHIPVRGDHPAATAPPHAERKRAAD